MFFRMLMAIPLITIQRSAKVGAPGLVNFITALAYHFCPSLPAAFTQQVASTLADLCKPIFEMVTRLALFSDARTWF